ncbi:hypothetical protein QQG55_39880 [Brugia pahangi]
MTTNDSKTETTIIIIKGTTCKQPQLNTNRGSVRNPTHLSAARQYSAYCLGPDTVSKVKLYQGFKLCNFAYKNSQLKGNDFTVLVCNLQKRELHECHLKIFTGDLNSHAKNKDRNFRITDSNRQQD